MKVFNKDDKINFVDQNNVFVGYDLAQDCCEFCEWYITNNIDIDIIDTLYNGNIKAFLKPKKNIKNIDDYVFDRNYIYETNFEHDGELCNIVVFKLVSPDKPENPDLFLHLFNFHNGYYYHNFTFGANNEIIKNSYL